MRHGYKNFFRRTWRNISSRIQKTTRNIFRQAARLHPNQIGKLSQTGFKWKFYHAPKGHRTRAHRSGAKRATKLSQSFVNTHAFPSGNVYSSPDELIEALRDWCNGAGQNATRLDGGVKSCRTPWVFFNIHHFQFVQISVPRYKQHIPYNVIDFHTLSARDFNGRYHLNGDTKKTAIEDLIHHWEFTDSLDDCSPPLLTEKNNKKLNRRGTNGAKGLYAFKD